MSVEMQVAPSHPVPSNDVAMESTDADAPHIESASLSHSSHSPDVHMADSTSVSPPLPAATPDTTFDSSSAPSNENNPLSALESTTPVTESVFSAPTSGGGGTPDSASSKKRRGSARVLAGLETKQPPVHKELILTPAQAELQRKKIPKGYALEPVYEQPKPEEPPVEGKRARRKVQRDDFLSPVNGHAADASVHAAPPVSAVSHRGRGGARGGRGGKRGGRGGAAASRPQKSLDPDRELLYLTKLELLKQRLGQTSSGTILNALSSSASRTPFQYSAPAAPEPEVYAPVTPAPRGRGGRGRGRGSASTGRKKATSRRQTAAPEEPLVYDPQPPSPSPVYTPITPSAPVYTPITPTAPVLDISSALEDASTPATADSSARTTTSRSHRPVKTPKFFNAESSSGKLSDPLRKCRDLVLKIMKHKWAFPFNQPVDYVALNLPTYPQVIKQPMDLGTVKQRLADNYYETVEAFDADVQLVWHNAMTFNAPGHDVHIMAKTLKGEFDEGLKKIMAPPDTKRKRVRSEKAASSRPAAAAGGAAGAGTATPKPPRARAPAAAAVPPAAVDPTPWATIEALQTQVAVMAEQLKKVQEAAATKRGGPKSGPLTYREKAALKEDIAKLPDDKQAHVLNLIRDENPDCALTEEDGVELDIDRLSTPVARKVQRYVKSALAPRNRGGAGTGRKRAPKGGAAAAHAAAPPPNGNPFATGPIQLEAMNSSLEQRQLNAQHPLDYGLISHHPSDMHAGSFQAGGPAESDSDSSSDSDSDSDDDGSRKRRKFPQPGMNFAAQAALADSKKKRPSAPPASSSAASPYPSFGDPSLFSAAPLDTGDQSVTHSGIIKTVELSPMAKTGSAEVKNVDTNVWSNFADTTMDESNPFAVPPGQGGDDKLWSDFKNKDVEMKQRQRELQEAEERARRQREEAEAERVREQERLARRQQEEAEARKRQAEAEQAEKARLLEQERLATLERVTQRDDAVNLDQQRLGGADVRSFKSNLKGLFGDD